MANRTARYGIQSEIRGARGVITSLNAIARALDATRLAGTKTFEIDRQIKRLGVQTGATSAEITRLQGATLGLAQATGVSIDKTTELINAYQATGQSIGKMIDSSGKAVDTFDAMQRAGTENYQMMTTLVGRFGIGAKAAVKMERSIGHLAGPAGFGKLLDKTTEFSDKFNVPGLIGELPKVVGFAMDSLSKFGRSVAGNSAEIINNTVRVGASFAQAFGVDAAEGISEAMAVQQRFLEQTRADQDVFLGLADDFDPLTKALMETGMSFQQIGEISRDAQKDPAAFVETMIQIRDQLGGEGDMFADRFFRNVQKSVPPAVQRLMAIPEALEDLKRAQKEAAEETGALTSFTKMADATKNIGAELLDTISRLALLGRTIVGLAFVEDFAEPLGGAVEVLKRFNTWLRETALTIRESAWFAEWKPRIQAVGKVLIALGAAAGVVASTFAGMIIPFQTAMSVLRLIPVLGGAAGVSFDGLGVAIKGFAKGVLKPLAILTGIGVALNDFGQALADPTISERPMEVFVRGLRAMAVGIVEVFDNVLMGIPTQIAKWFYPEMQGTLGDATRDLFTDLQIWLETGASETGGSWWSAFKDKVSTGLTEFYDWLNGQLNVWHVQAAEWGKNIGRAIGTLAHWAWEAISPFFRRETWAAGWKTVTDYFSGTAKEQMVGSVGGTLQAVLGVVGTFARNMVDEILRPWGMGWLEAENKFLHWWDALSLGFHWLTHEGIPVFEEKWFRFKIGLVESYFALQEGSRVAFESIKGGLLVVSGELGATWQQLRGYYYEGVRMKAQLAHDVAMVTDTEHFIYSTAESNALDLLNTAMAFGSDDDQTLAAAVFNAAKTARINYEKTTVSYRPVAAAEREIERTVTEGATFTDRAERGRQVIAGATYDTSGVAERSAEATRRDRIQLGGLTGYSLEGGLWQQGRVQLGQEAHSRYAEDLGAKANARDADYKQKESVRDEERARETARGIAISNEFQPIKRDLVDRTGRIISELRIAQSEQAADSPNHRAYGILLADARNAQRAIDGAGSGLVATRRWNALLESIDRVEGLRDKLAKNTNTPLEGQAYSSALFEEEVVPSAGIAAASVSTAPDRAPLEAEALAGGPGPAALSGAAAAQREVRHVVEAVMGPDGVMRWFLDTSMSDFMGSGMWD